MKAAETIIHLRREEPQRMKNMVPAHVWQLMQPYGLAPEPGELPASPASVVPATAPR
jgi:coenzyme F420 hydrogenase subunit beta